MARFLHLNDIHAVREGALVSGVLDTCALLEQAINTVLRRREELGQLDGVIVTGDITDDGSEEGYRFARAQLERLKLPLFIIPGNHDAREPLRRTFADQSGMPTEGLIDWTVDIADTRIIGLDTLVEGQGAGRLRPESIRHLRNALHCAGSRRVVIAMHHPPFATGIGFMDEIGLENPEVLAQTIADAGAVGQIIAGHIHGVHSSMVANMPAYVGPSTCSAINVDVTPDAFFGFTSGPTGFAVLDTGGNGRWSVVPLDRGAGPFPF